MIIEFKTYTGIIDKNKGIYKAFMQYVLSKRPYDLSPNKNKLDSYKIMDENIKIEDHHIIPKSWIKNNIKLQNENIIDSCLNRVYISEEANRGREDGIFAQNTGKYLENIPDDSIKSLFIPEILKESCTMDENQYIEYIKSRYKLVKHEIQSEIIDLI